MGNTTVGSAIKTMDSMVRGSNDDLNLEEKLPDGDRYNGFVNVIKRFIIFNKHYL